MSAEVPRPLGVSEAEWRLTCAVLAACKSSGVPRSEWATVLGALALTLTRQEMARSGS